MPVFLQGLFLGIILFNMPCILASFYALLYFIKNWALVKPATCPNLWRLAPGRRRHSLISLLWKPKVFSGLFWLYISPGFVHVLLYNSPMYTAIFKCHACSKSLFASSWGLHCLLYTSISNLVSSVCRSVAPLEFS